MNSVHMVTSARSPHSTPARSARSRTLGDDTRAELLAAARDLFLETGPAAFSLREVARRVGVSAAAVYRHFDGKEALVQAASTQGFQLFSSYLVRALAAPSALARLLAAGDQYRHFALENPLDYRFIFMGAAEETVAPDCKQPSQEESVGMPQDSTFRFLVDRVRECMDEGVLATGDPEKIAVLIWGHVHGLVSLRISGHLRPLGDEQAFAFFYGESVERLLRGLAP